MDLKINSHLLFGGLCLFLILTCRLAESQPVNAPMVPMTVGQIKYNGGNWNPRANGPRSLFRYMQQRTSLELDTELVGVAPGSKDIFSYPLLFWTGDQDFAEFSTQEIENLRRFLRFGGFIFIDDNQGSLGHGFDQAVRRELKKIFPDLPLNKINNEHTVFRSFYLLDRAYGRLRQPAYLEGINVDRRTVVIFSHNDLLGAVAQDRFGNWEYGEDSGEPQQRKRSFQLGVNIIMYALCDDYKKDALHVEYILKRRH